MRRLGWVKLLAALGAVFLSSTSCGSAGEVVEPSLRAEPPSWLRDGHLSAAAAGGDLVAVPDATGTAPPEVRHPDGTWEDLPRLPARGQFGILLSVGDTVVAAGSECRNDCEAGPFRMFMLSKDRSEWRHLDGPDITVTSDTEIVPYPNPLHYAVIYLSGEYYRVSEDGAVRRIPALPTREAVPDIDNGSFVCVGAETMTVVPHHHEEMAGIKLELAGEVSVLRLDDLAAGWISAGPVPAATSTNYNGSMCGPETATFYGGATQTTFNYSTRQWTSGAANFQELTGTDQVPSTWSGGLAFSPDGGTAFVIVDKKVLERVGGGPWHDTGKTAWSIAPTLRPSSSTSLTSLPDSK